MKTKTLTKLSSIVATLLCIVIGLILAFVVLLVTYSATKSSSVSAITGRFSSASWGMKKILSLGLSNPSSYSEYLRRFTTLKYNIGQVLYYAMPLIMTGLSVAFAFKTGLFNIGASGQYLFGGIAAIICAGMLHLPWYVSIFAALIAGAIWGAIPGLFKAYLNINEVITCIMTNWIGLYLVNIFVYNTPAIQSLGADSSRTLTLTGDGIILSRLNLASLFAGNDNVSVGIIVAIVFAIVVWVILYKTTFGYELKACGLNKNAAKYAGINDKKNIILSMVVAGALAGVGGALYYLTGNNGAVYKTEEVLQQAGFDGISVALLGGSNPIGVIFSGLFIAFLKVGGDNLQPVYNTEIVSVITSTIIYFSAFSLFFRNLILKGRVKRDLAISNQSNILNKPPVIADIKGGEKQ
ncbi:MAG: ABC transporter permease [Bacillales bacterium]|nr:ABC transporter permease [Bacillales bacterium]